MKTFNKGFSLIELMIVIAIIGILAAIAVPSYQAYVAKARMSQFLTVIQSGQTAIAEYVASTGVADCVGITQPTLPNIPGLDDFHYGDFIAGVSCFVETDGSIGSGDDNYIYLWYVGTTTDAGMTWECFYQTDSGNDVTTVPAGCTSDN